MQRCAIQPFSPVSAALTTDAELAHTTTHAQHGCWSTEIKLSAAYQETAQIRVTFIIFPHMNTVLLM